MIKAINGFDEYFVTDDGEIFSNKSGTLKKLAKYISASGNGYYSVDLCMNGKVFKRSIHRIVAEHFVDNPDNKPIVDHKDDDKLNCLASNLQWVTTRENIHKSYNTMSPVRNFKECCLYKGDIIIGEFQSVNAASKYAAENFDVKYTMINKHRAVGDVRIVKKV